MDSITLPVWQFIGAIALPSIVLFMLVARLLAKKRRLRRNSAATKDGFHPAKAQTYEGRIFQEMVSQQIDSVFNALNALIEAERVKLKALLLRQTDCGPAVQSFFRTTHQDFTEGTEKFNHDLNHHQHGDWDNDPVEDPAGDGQISRNEAALATMLRNQTNKKRQRVKAVA